MLAAHGRLPIRHLTPHTLRRTFASIPALCNVPPRGAMYVLGHTDPTLTLAVYQQVLDIGSAAVADSRRPWAPRWRRPTSSSAGGVPKTGFS